jgi:hypothetical protein|tara:strand:+ start:306 stop:548 length:243 start_codon:yes stop_codon:yes gene_type:complete
MNPVKPRLLTIGDEQGLVATLDKVFAEAADEKTTMPLLHKKLSSRARSVTLWVLYSCEFFSPLSPGSSFWTPAWGPLNPS